MPPKAGIQNETETNVEICSARIIHREILETVQAAMPGDDEICDLADFFKIFGDRTRISILWALSESEMCVCDLCALLDMKQSAVSHQLKLLKQSRILKHRREGKVVYYSLNDEHIRRVLNLGLQQVRE
ncbi:MAG: helix-turn-helix transcriptional regulator [Desulfobacterales bacterium]|nr:helix-turn-helix transcriptional regulator [Desulfobacterales bacterium]MBS3755401.1 helix-turn-helix transcriptional regulator [Desulfobacterales bacterium]